MKFNRKNMRFYKEKLEMIVMVIGAIGTVASIFFGLDEINSTLKEQRFSNRLELADDMINEYISLSEEASKAVLYIIAESNGYANECQSLADSPRKHASQLEEMKKKILAYGSTELVNLFFDSYNDVQITVENDANDFDSFKSYFYYMPLIASYIKYDLTGEIVNPSIFYNSIMTELKELEKAQGMENFHLEMINTNNLLIQKYHLSKDFVWLED